MDSVNILSLLKNGDWVGYCGSEHSEPFKLFKLNDDGGPEGTVVDAVTRKPIEEELPKFIRVCKKCMSKAGGDLTKTKFTTAKVTDVDVFGPWFARKS